MADQIPQRRIEVAVQLAANSGTNQPNTFAGTGGSDTVTLRGSRTSVRIQNSGTPSGGRATISVYGMTDSLMNQLATLGLVFNLVPKNTVTITAGDEGGQMSTVFAGTILAAYADYSQAPEVPFIFEANAGLANSVQATVPTSFAGTADVATMMAGFAKQMGIGFENNGVTTQISNPYFWGNVKTQVQECAAAAGINAEILGNTLAIWPKGGSRNTPSPVLIAPHPIGQMIGYPAYTQQGIIVSNVFDPKISYGSLIKVQSSLKTVNDVGTWAINKLDLALDSQVYGGQWMQMITAYNPKYPRPVIGSI